MSKLRDCNGKINQLLQAADSADNSYQYALRLYRALESGQDVDLSGLGMKLTFEDGTEVPVPMTGDHAHILAAVEQSVTFLASETIRLWGEIYRVAGEANKHCAEAVERANQQQVQQQLQPLPPQPVVAGGSVQPVGQVPIIPRLGPINTVDVTAQKR